MGPAESSLQFNQFVEFSVDPRQQAPLVAALTDQAQRLICTFPGFISATVQASDDGTRVISQVLWQSRHASEAALLNAEPSAQDFTELLLQHRVSAVSFNALAIKSRIGPRV